MGKFSKENCVVFSSLCNLFYQAHKNSSDHLVNSEIHPTVWKIQKFIQLFGKFRNSSNCLENSEIHPTVWKIASQQVIKLSSMNYVQEQIFNGARNRMKPSIFVLIYESNHLGKSFSNDQVFTSFLP